MARSDSSIYIPCDCGCCVLEISKWKLGDDEFWYDISVLDSRYDHEANGVWNRIRRAVKALLGKPVYFNDVTLNQEQFDDLISQMGGLCDHEMD